MADPDTKILTKFADRKVVSTAELLDICVGDIVGDMVGDILGDIVVGDIVGDIVQVATF
jgi:hypothetical protein